MDGRKYRIVTPQQFGAGWTVFAGFDADGRVRTKSLPMREIARHADGNIVVEDESAVEEAGPVAPPAGV